MSDNIIKQSKVEKSLDERQINRFKNISKSFFKGAGNFFISFNEKISKGVVSQINSGFKKQLENSIESVKNGIKDKVSQSIEKVKKNFMDKLLDFIVLLELAIIGGNMFPFKFDNICKKIVSYSNMFVSYSTSVLENFNDFFGVIKKNFNIDLMDVKENIEHNIRPIIMKVIDSFGIGLNNFFNGTSPNVFVDWLYTISITISKESQGIMQWIVRFFADSVYESVCKRPNLKHLFFFSYEAYETGQKVESVIHKTTQISHDNIVMPKWESTDYETFENKMNMEKLLRGKYAKYTDFDDWVIRAVNNIYYSELQKKGDKFKINSDVDVDKVADWLIENEDAENAIGGQLGESFLFRKNFLNYVKKNKQRLISSVQNTFKKLQDEDEGLDQTVHVYYGVRTSDETKIRQAVGEAMENRNEVFKAMVEKWQKNKYEYQNIMNSEAFDNALQSYENLEKRVRRNTRFGQELNIDDIYISRVDFKKEADIINKFYNANKSQTSVFVSRLCSLIEEIKDLKGYDGKYNSLKFAFFIPYVLYGIMQYEYMVYRAQSIHLKRADNYRGIELMLSKNSKRDGSMDIFYKILKKNAVYTDDQYNQFLSEMHSLDALNDITPYKYFDFLDTFSYILESYKKSCSDLNESIINKAPTKSFDMYDLVNSASEGVITTSNKISDKKRVWRNISDILESIKKGMDKMLKEKQRQYSKRLTLLNELYDIFDNIKNSMIPKNANEKNQPIKIVDV